MSEPSTDNSDWRTYTFVVVLMRGLPPNVKTVDIHRNLKKYGNIVKISLKETRQGNTYRNAEVIFKPPPTFELWQRGCIFNFTTETNVSSCVRFSLSDRQRRNFTIKSPVRKGVQYNEELVLEASSVDFGILHNERKMTAQRSVSALSQKREGRIITVPTQMIVNLKRMQLEVKFPVWLHSANGDRVREYRFFIALDDKFSIWQVSSSDGSLCYILHVPNAPWYSRRLEQQIASSHVEDGKHWREDDQWTRQTDIVDSKEDFATIDNHPVSIQKLLNTINIARWTTFKVNLPTEAQASDTTKILRNALRDFNIRVIQVEDFETHYPSAAIKASYWSIMPTITNQDGLDGLYRRVRFEMTFDVRYQLEVCISQGWLSEYDLTESFLERLCSLPEYKAKQTLIHVDSLQERVFDPMTIFSNVKYQKPIKARKLPPNCVEVRHATVTATGIKLYTPTVEQTNRVIRRYKASSSFFLRVRFEDDEYRGQTKLYASSTSKMVLVFARVKRTLKQGINVAGRHFAFLAWGNSQLREHGCYFFCNDDKGLTADTIRSQMGVFDNENTVAKRAARMGQCFSTTSPIPVRVPLVSRASCIPDVTKGKYNFTDGVGKVSPLLAGLIHSALRISGPVPSCFQFRLGGCKGVLVVDPLLNGIDIKVRESQFKFDSASQELEVIRWSEYWQPFLNRQLIAVLSNLGVPDETFLDMQKSAVQALDAAMHDDKAALQALRDNVDPNRMTPIIAGLVSNGFRHAKEPFVLSILNLWRVWSLKYLKEKAKIPISQGCFVLGVVDETGILRGHFDNLQLPQHAPNEDKATCLPEIFVQYIDPHTGKKKIVEGLCILARNPSLHKGDIRVVKAVNVPALRHLCDVVAMPQNGDRDLPSMCSGGDLDGDDYVVCWDEKLIPTFWNANPFHYDAPTPVTAGGDIGTEHIIDFFHDYLQNDFLGRIAHAHLGAADFYDDGVENQQCLDLLHLHSMAVDYPKTGVPASLPRRLERSEWPHFMEKRGKSYKSHKILGQLYDSIKREDFDVQTECTFDPRILNSLTPTESIKAQAGALKHEYDVAMQQIMAQHKIRTEFEVWSTFVLDHSKASGDYKFHEEIGQLSKNLKELYYESIVEVCGGSSYACLSEFAVAAYQVTNEEFMAAIAEIDDNAVGVERRLPFISFPWLLADTLGKIASLSQPISESKLEIGHIPDIPVVDDKNMVETGQDRVPRCGRIDKTDESLAGAGKKALISTSDAPTGGIGIGHSERAGGHNDPFINLNPFKGLTLAKKKVSKTPKYAGRSSDKGKPTARNETKRNSEDSFVLVDRPACDPSPSTRTDVNDQKGLRNGSVSTITQMISFNDAAGEDKVKAAEASSLDTDTFTMSGGMLKDPAEMTAEEMRALGLGDDDDDF